MDDNFKNGWNPEEADQTPSVQGASDTDDAADVDAGFDQTAGSTDASTSTGAGVSTGGDASTSAGTDASTGAYTGTGNSTAADNSTTSGDGTTYSWVNPRLRQSQNSQSNPYQNPWNSRNGSDYWSTRTNNTGNTYTGSNNTGSNYTGGNNTGSNYTGSNNTGSNYTGSNNTGNTTGYSSGSSAANGTANYNYRSSYTSDNPNKERRSFFEGQNQNGSYNGQSGYNTYGGPAGGSGGPRKPGKNRRPRRNRGDGGRKWGVVVAMALVFGLIAGTVSYATNAIANHIRPVEKTADASSEEDQESVFQSGSNEISSSSGEIQSTAAAPEEGSAGSSAEGQMTVADVAENCMPSMVTISTMSVEQMQSLFGGTQSYDVEGAGTGIIIGQNDTELLIASNNHVVENANEVSVGFVDESVEKASIKGTDPDNDIAVVAVKLDDISDETKSAIREAKIGDSDNLVLGDQVVAIGNALGYGQSVTSGYVSALNRELELSDGTNTFTSKGLIQTDAAINSGNSGGGLFNMKGELIGINEAKSSGSGSSQEASVDNIGFAIPTDKALPILQELMKQETKEVIDEDKRGYLGVSCADVSDEYSQLYDMPEGVCFTSVLSGGPAEKAGAKKGDVLVEFDGEKITTYDALKDALKYHSAGDTVEITVKRADNGDYKDVKLTVTLATADDAGINQNNASAGNGQQPGQGGQSQEPGQGGSGSGDSNGQDQNSQSSSDENQQEEQMQDPFKGTPFEGFFGF